MINKLVTQILNYIFITIITTTSLFITEVYSDDNADKIYNEESKKILDTIMSYQDVMINGNYVGAWEMFTKRTQLVVPLEDFILLWLRPEFRDKKQQLFECELKKCILINEKRAWVFIEPVIKEFSVGYYLIKEDSLWKIDSLILSFNKVKKDLENIDSAINKYFSDNGEFPEELSQLVPDYLSEIPEDSFNPKEEVYRYNKSNDAYRVYSVGLDGIDNGGEINMNPLYDGFKEGDIYTE